MRGADAAGGGVPAGDQLPGPLPERVQRAQGVPAAAGHGLPHARLQAAPVAEHAAQRRHARPVHRQQHHARPAAGVRVAGADEAQVGAVRGDGARLPAAPHGQAAARRLRPARRPQARAHLHRALRPRLQVLPLLAKYDSCIKYSGSPEWFRMDNKKRILTKPASGHTSSYHLN